MKLSMRLENEGYVVNKTKRLIFNSGIEIFSKAGYRGATMDDIAKRAGLAKGTLYYNFTSKEDIFNFIVEEGLNILNDRILKVKEMDISSIEKLKQTCNIQLTFLYENKDFFKVVMSQLWGNEERQIVLREKIKNYIKELEFYIKCGIEEGKIRTGDSRLMAYGVFGTLCSAAIYELINIEKIDLENLIEKTLEFTLNGLATE